MKTVDPMGLATRMTSLSPYEARNVTFLGLEQLDEWIVKLYSVTIAGRDAANQTLVDVALRAASVLLPTPAVTAGRSGVGFAIVHESVVNSYVLVCWWDEENEIHQRVLSAPSEQPHLLTDHPTSAIGCVWELSVTDFERRAWLEHVLQPIDGPNLGRYLEQGMNGHV